jgi:PAS domain S-box-containing protein
MFEDITERKQIEVALKRSEVKYRLLIENASQGVIVVHDGVIKYANPKVLEVSGYSFDELTSHSFIDFIHSDDREATYERHLKRLAGELTDEPHVYRVINKDGECLWVESSAVTIKWDGESAHLSFLTDITKRKHVEGALIRSEEKFQDLVENIDDIIYIIDGSGKIIFLNGTLEKLFGFKKEEIIGRNINEFLLPESYEVAREVFKNKSPVKMSAFLS